MIDTVSKNGQPTHRHLLSLRLRERTEVKRGRMGREDEVSTTKARARAEFDAMHLWPINKIT